MQTFKYFAVVLLAFVLSNTSHSQTFEQYYSKGDEALKNRDFSTAILNFKKALEIKPERLLQTKDEVQIFAKISQVYLEIAEYQMALEFMFKYVETEAIKKDSVILASSYNRIGINYHYLNQDQKSLVYYQKSLEFNGKDTLRVASTSNNIANVYYKMGQFDKAKEYFSQAFTFFSAKDNYEGRVATIMNLGLIEMESHHMENALKYFADAEKMAETKKDTLSLIAININLGDYYTLVTDYAKAEAYLTWALEKSEKMNSTMLAMESYKSLVNLFKTAKDYKRAFDYLELYKAGTDSINASNLNREYAELEIKYAIREKEKENVALKSTQQLNDLQIATQRKYIWSLAGLLGLMFGFIAVFYFQRKKLRKSKSLLENQHKELSKSQKQLQDLNHQYEKLIEKYEVHPDRPNISGPLNDNI